MKVTRVLRSLELGHVQGFQVTLLKYFLFNIFASKISVIIGSFIRMKITLTCSKNPEKILDYYHQKYTISLYERDF